MILLRRAPVVQLGYFQSTQALVNRFHHGLRACGNGLSVYDAGATRDSQCYDVVSLSLISADLLQQYSLVDCCHGCKVGGCNVEGAAPEVKMAIDVFLEEYGFFPAHRVII